MKRFRALAISTRILLRFRLPPFRIWFRRLKKGTSYGVALTVRTTSSALNKSSAASSSSLACSAWCSFVRCMPAASMHTRAIFYPVLDLDASGSWQLKLLIWVLYDRYSGLNARVRFFLQPSIFPTTCTTWNQALSWIFGCHHIFKEGIIKTFLKGRF